MSTIASPRPSFTLSRQNSNSTDTTVRSSSTSHTTTLPTNTHGSDKARRNRAALRDYYNIKPSDSLASQSLAPSSLTNTQSDDLSSLSRTPLDQSSKDGLDDPSFNANTYVSTLLASTDLQGLLQTEARLLSEIRGLDGERKALVYDNYSKLIAASETIGRVLRSGSQSHDSVYHERTISDALSGNNSKPRELVPPALDTLWSTMAQIVSTAEKIAKVDVAGQKSLAIEIAKHEKDEKRDVVRWVLDAPDRLERMLASDNETPDAVRKTDHAEAARKEWDKVQRILNEWEGVDGVEDLRKRCLAVMQPVLQTSPTTIIADTAAPSTADDIDNTDLSVELKAN